MYLSGPVVGEFDNAWIVILQFNCCEVPEKLLRWKKYFALKILLYNCRLYNEWVIWESLKDIVVMDNKPISVQ